MPDAKHLPGNVSPQPGGRVPGYDAAERCCLCDELIGHGQVVEQAFETDSTGTTYRAHAKCSHEYGMMQRALRRIADDVTPSF